MVSPSPKSIPLIKENTLKTEVERILLTGEGNFSPSHKQLLYRQIGKVLESLRIPREVLFSSDVTGSAVDGWKRNKEIIEDVFLHNLGSKELENKWRMRKSYFSLIRNGKRLAAETLGWMRVTGNSEGKEKVLLGILSTHGMKVFWRDVMFNDIPIVVRDYI